MIKSLLKSFIVGPKYGERSRRRMVGSTTHMKHFLLSYSTEERTDKYYDKREKLGTLLDDGFGDEASFARFSQNVMAKRESTNSRGVRSREVQRYLGRWKGHTGRTVS